MGYASSTAKLPESSYGRSVQVGHPSYRRMMVLSKTLLSLQAYQASYQPSLPPLDGSLRRMIFIQSQQLLPDVLLLDIVSSKIGIIPLVL